MKQLIYTITCDECGKTGPTALEGDESTADLDAKAEGWVSDDTGDYCRQCAKKLGK